MKQKLSNTTKKHGPKAVVFLLLAAMLLTFLPPVPGSFAAFDSDKAIDDKWGQVSALPASLSDGQVWTGKTVDAKTSTTDPSDVDMTNDQFKVTLSALGQKFTTQTGSTQQYDIVFVLDKSTSMDSNSKLTNMRSAASTAINALLEDNTASLYNRVSVVAFGINAARVSDWTSAGQTTYTLPSFTTEAGTNIQQGLYVAKPQLDTVRANAIPVIILLTDGAPNRHAAYNFTSGTPTWVNGSNYNAEGSDDSAAYSILYAAWLKAQYSNLKFYTVGFDVASSARATSVLNPAGGLTTAISNYITNTARATSGVSALTSLIYPNQYYAASTTEISEILTLVTSTILANPPISGDLVITDDLGSQFSFTLSGSNVLFNIDGSAKVAAYQGAGANAGKYAYTGPEGTVVFDVATGYVTYTIPAAALKCLDAGSTSTTGAELNKLSFDVELFNTAAADVNYYTNYNNDAAYNNRNTAPGASAAFTPAAGNTYYGYVPGTSTVVNGSDTYSNAAFVAGHWDTSYETIVPASPSSNAVYTPEGFSMTSVTVAGYTFTGVSVGTAGTSGGNRYYPITVSETKAVSGSDKIVASFTFNYFPNVTPHYSTPSGSITRYAWISSTWSSTGTSETRGTPSGDYTGTIGQSNFDLPSVTFGSYTFNNPDVGSFNNQPNTSNDYYNITLTSSHAIQNSGSAKIVPNMSFRYYPYASGTARFQNLNNSDTITSYAWIANFNNWDTNGTSVTFAAADLSSNASYTAENLSMTSVTFNGNTFTGISVGTPTGTGTSRSFPITVSETKAVNGADKIEAYIIFNYLPNQSGASRFTSYNGSGDYIRVYDWIAEQTAVTQFTVITTPSAVGQTASVSIDPDGTPGTGDEKTYTGPATARTDATHWTFKTTIDNGDVVTVYTIVLNGTTLTVSSVETTTTSGYFDSPLVVGGIVTQTLPNSGMIRLKTALADLTIKKNVTTFGGATIPQVDIPVNGFEFTLSTGPSGASSLFPYILTGVLYNAANEIINNAYQFTANGKFYLNAGEYIKVTLPVGSVYSVYETPAPGYVTMSQNAMGNVGAPMDPVVFTNTYYPTATINITKNIVTLYDSAAVEADVTFNFALYYKNANDQYVNIPVTPAPSITTADGSDADSLVDKTYTVPVSIRLDTLELLELFNGGDTATIYVHETAPANPGLGWVLDNGYYPVTITKTGTVTQPTAVTNKYQPTAQLTLTKTVDVGSADKLFHFDIEIGAPADAAYQYNYAVTVAGTPVDGSPFTGTGSKIVSVDLKNNQSAVITGIPVGATYTVKEDNYSGDYYFSNWPVDANERPTKTGSIAEGNNAVGITNTHETRDLTITKNVAGIVKNPGDSFDFVVKDSAGATVGSFTLSPDNSYTKTLPDLFVGETYTVTESGSTMSEYKTTVQKTVGSAVGIAESYSITNGYSFALEKNDTTLLFTNTFKEGQLKVTKSVIGTEPASASPIVYGIQVMFSGSNLDQITCSVNSSAVTATQPGEFNLSLAKDGYADFSNIPEGVTYTVSETNKQTADHVDYTYGDSTKKIMDGDQDTVTVTNTYDTPSELTISKDVPDTGYDRTAGRFDFSISFYTLVPPVEEDAEPVKTPYTLLTNELPTVNPNTATADVNFSKVDGTETVPVHYTFSLANDEQLIFTDLPVGIYYTVTELSAGGARSSFVNVVEQIDLTATGDIKNDGETVNVTFVNNFNIDTGSLTLSKTVTGDTMIAPASYDFTVVFTEQMNGITLGDNQGIKDEVAGTVTFNVTLSANGNSVKFDGLKGGTEYTITELTAADSTVFTGADSTADVDGKKTASGTMILPNGSWEVTDEAVTCTNNYTPPATTTVKDAFKTTDDGLAAISAEGSDNHAVAVGGVYVGDTVTYKITVTNSGPKTLRLDYIFDVMFGSIAANNVTVIGPDELNITAFSLGPVSGGNALTLTGGVMLEPTKSVTVTYTTSYSDAGPKTNTATSYATYAFNYNGIPGTKTVNSDDDAKINVYYHSDMTLVKDVAAGVPVVTDNDGINIDISGLSFGENATVDYLDDVTYRLTIKNIKEAPLSNVTITDYQLTSGNLVGVIKNGSVLAPSAYSINADLSDAADDHILTLTGSLLKDDVIVILYTLKPIESHLNTAIVQAFDGLTTFDKEDTANVTVIMPTITVTKTATPLTVITGNTAVYSITIRNDYDRTLDLTSVQDNFFLPSSDYAVSNIQYKIGSGASADITPDSTGKITFPSGTTFEPGLNNAVVITYIVTFTTEKSYDNTANVTAAYKELPVYGTDTETVRVKDPSAILVTKLVNDKAEDTVLAGSTVTYTVTIQNNGKAPLGDLTLTDPLFDNATITGLTLTDGSTTTDLAYTPNPMSGTVLTITPPTGAQQGDSTEPPAPNTFFFNPGATIKLTYTAVMNATYTNTVIVNGLADTEDEVEEDASAKVTVYTPPVIIEYGALTVDKTVSGNNPSATEKFAFTVTFTPGTMNVLGITNSAGLTGTNGVYTFSLSANDTPVTFSNIPLGTGYTVSEALTIDQGNSGWTAPTASSGTISAITPVTVTVNNVYDAGVEGSSDKPDDESGVAGDSDKLPQTGGISLSTLIGLFGLALIAIGGTSITIFRRKNNGKSN